MKLDDDDFTLFGLPRRFGIQRAEVDARWRALQGEVHPDRFVAQGPAAQRMAMQWAVRVNQAHQRLKDPLRRAALLCELAGAPIDAERNTAMPTAFLMQQMQWREDLGDAADAAAIAALDSAVQTHEARALDELADLLDVQHDMPAAAQQVRALMFVARFRQDIDQRLAAFDA